MSYFSCSQLYYLNSVHDFSYDYIIYGAQMKLIYELIIGELSVKMNISFMIHSSKNSSY